MSYPAKILLFGEYGIILNSMALAIPYPRFSGQFKWSDSSTKSPLHTAIESNKELKNLFAFLKNKAGKFQSLNLNLFEDEVNKGLFFDSSVPIGSGLGSSGALTAAIYERYVTHVSQNDYQFIKTEMGAIESFFHGKSSGFDPLISYLKRPIMIDNHSSVITSFDLARFFNNYTLFLVNTNSNGDTGALVSYFLENYKNHDFKNSIDNEYIPLVNEVIGSVINTDFDSFDELIARYSEFQLAHFGAMVPIKMRKYFEHGIESGDFYLKLCGSGGGGYMLGLATNRLRAESYFNLNHLEYMVVNHSEL